MTDLIAFAQAMGDETRWRIVQLIRDQALCVCEVAEILQMPQSSVSSHLQVIRKAGMLAHERCEKWIYYRLLPEFRDVVIFMGNRFEASAATNTKLSGDAKRSIKRLAKRESTCCPGPRELVGSPRKPKDKSAVNGRRAVGPKL